MSELHKFLFEGLPVRGMLVRLTDGWREALARRVASQATPRPVRALMGEMAAAALLMQSNIKFNGALVLQMIGDGPVKLAVAEARSDASFRVTAKVAGEVAEDARLQALLNVRGRGRCAITLDPQERLPGQQPYQGVVPLFRDSFGGGREPLQKLSDVLEHYMLQSEQLDTRLVLAADDSVAAGLLIQRLPAEGGRVANVGEIGVSEGFDRIAHLTATLSSGELLGLDAEDILHRLYWHERLLRLDAGAAPRFACTCSRERVAQMLKGLGRDEIDGIVVEQGRVEVACEFCGAKYAFDPVDVGEMFTAPRDQPPVPRGVQ
jgi:molecular chaperone Hsp33